MTTTDTETVRTREVRPLLALVTLALPSLLIAMDISLMTIALPSMGADLDASATELLWMSDVYGLLVAGSMVTMGAVGDRFGRRRLILVCATVFALASAVGAFATSPETVIGARAVMGIAGSGIMPASMALIGVVFTDPARRASALGAYMTCFLVGMATAPFVGGLMLSAWWWGSLFLLGIPVMVVVLVVGPRTLPEFRASEPGPLDLVGAGLSLGAVLLLVTALKEAVAGAPALVVAGLVVLGLAAGVAFVRRQLAAEHPLVDLSLFRDRHLVRVMASLLLTAVIMGGSSIYVTLYLQDVRDQTPLQTAGWLAPQMVAMIAASNVGPWLAARTGRQRVVRWSLVVMTGGFVCFALVPQSNGGLVVLALGSCLATSGIGAALPLLMDDLIGSAPPERAGSAASLAQTCNELGIALGLVVLGSLGTLVYRARLDGAPADAQDGIVRATTLAESTGDGALLDAARLAYGDAFHAVGLAGVTVMLVVLALTWRGRQASVSTRPSATASA